ncbi:hypothetical protein QQM79_08265 [Marinobacteraceae bacterium S3BR75-40.1]
MDSAEARERTRLKFIADRDGITEALAFAHQGIGQYQAALEEADSGGNQYGAAYRAELLASIRVYQQYLDQG